MGKEGVFDSLSCSMNISLWNGRKFQLAIEAEVTIRVMIVLLLNLIFFCFVASLKTDLTNVLDNIHVDNGQHGLADHSFGSPAGAVSVCHWDRCDLVEGRWGWCPWTPRGHRGHLSWWLQQTRPMYQWWVLLCFKEQQSFPTPDSWDSPSLVSVLEWVSLLKNVWTQTH